MIPLLAFILIMLSVNDLSGTGRFNFGEQRKWEVNSSDGGTWHSMQARTPKSQNQFHSFKNITSEDFAPKASRTHSPKALRLLAPKQTIAKHKKASSGSQELSSIENLNAPVESNHHTEEFDISTESNQVPNDCSIVFEVAGTSILLKNSAGVDRTKLSRDGDKIIYWSRPFHVERVWDMFGNELEVLHRCLPIPEQNKMVIIPTSTGAMTLTLQNSADINTDLLKIIDNTIVYFPADFFAAARSWDFSGNEC